MEQTLGTRKQVVLSGIRPTGRLHLGNYLGALQRFAVFSQQPDYQCYFFVADLHALTTAGQEAVNIRENLPNVILDYLAAGVDPEKAALFIQSSIPETLELFWYLACLMPLGDLERIPTFKDKIRLHPENVNAGLLNYPVLMAADILGPRADLVPVGKDQKPHLEVTVYLARRFNRLFGKLFPEPDALEQEMIIVPGLDGSSKMGKSEGNTVNLDDSPQTVRDKLRKAMTDPARKRRNDAGTPSKCNVFLLHTLMSGNEEISRCANGCRTAAMGCAECKDILAKNINNLLGPFQSRRASLAKQPDLVRDVLVSGRQQARAVIAETVAEARNHIGILGYASDKREDSHED